MAKPYGRRHHTIRHRLLPLAYGTPCPRCGELMLATQQLDLDHSDPRTKDLGLPGDRITHRYCNKRGLQLADAAEKPAVSRQW